MMLFECQFCRGGFELEDTVEVEVEDDDGEVATGWVCLDCYHETEWGEE